MELNGNVDVSEAKDGLREERPMVSVVMAAYNTRQEYFKESVQSILGQTFSNFEFIVIDDGLSDENRSYLASISDKRLKILVNENNLGQSVSVNKGLNIARGKYIARMDSDDVALPMRLKLQVSYMESHPNCLACGGYAETTDRHRIVPCSYPDLASRCIGLFFACDMVHPTMMIRRASLTDFGISYDKDQLYAQDYMLWIDFLCNGEIGIVEDIVLRYRVHSGQISTKKRESQGRYAVRAQKKLYHWRGFDTEDIDFNLHYSFVNDSLNMSFIKLLNHLINLKKQAVDCLPRLDAVLFKMELDYRAIKAGAREIARKGSVWKGLLLLLTYGIRFSNWGYYAARSRPPRF